MLNNKVKSSTITFNFVPEISTVNSSKYLGVLSDISLNIFYLQKEWSNARKIGDHFSRFLLPKLCSDF